MVKEGDRMAKMDEGAFIHICLLTRAGSRMKEPEQADMRAVKRAPYKKQDEQEKGVEVKETKEDKPEQIVHPTIQSKPEVDSRANFV